MGFYDEFLKKYRVFEKIRNFVLKLRLLNGEFLKTEFFEKTRNFVLKLRLLNENSVS